MKRRQLPLFRWSTLRPILLTLTLLACGCRILLAETGDELVAPNSNEAPAGRLQNGVLTIRIETAMGKWYPEENDGPALKVAAFREEGGRLSTPGPLLRVQEDTQIHVSVHNRLDQLLTLHGLHSRPGDAKDVLVVPSGERREVNFLAGVPGTYFYWGCQSGAEAVAQRRVKLKNHLNTSVLVHLCIYRPARVQK